ncbi:uncharacterized protein GBIM_12636 [Gryllus bimaculatus]|nr:uncharacterized protein GBIM_12636 [Gryllus bimaculatus]
MCSRRSRCDAGFVVPYSQMRTKVPVLSSSTRPWIGVLSMCPQCGRAYRRRDTMLRHLARECQRDPQLACVVCSRRFYHEHHRQNHMRRVHGLDALAFTLSTIEEILGEPVDFGPLLMTAEPSGVGEVAIDEFTFDDDELFADNVHDFDASSNQVGDSVRNEIRQEFLSCLRRKLNAALTSRPLRRSPEDC